MLVRKNYYLYEENDEMQQGKRKLLGSVRLTRNGEQWTVEIQWKNEREAEALVTKAGEGELQLQIREKEIILGQERQKREFSQEKQENDERIKKEQRPIEELEEEQGEAAGEQNETGNRTEIHREERNDIVENTREDREKELSENAGEDREKELSENTEESIEENIEKNAKDVENAGNTNADKIEEQELPVTATESEREENRQDQEWELVRRSCHKVEACRELGEVYRVNKGEFAVLPESIKHILQNSFLVHGLMNYGYLLLFRADEKIKQFGVGVPGVYYEKEKLVAEMFGFPQFWCDGKSNNGKFGYYLRIVS